MKTRQKRIGSLVYCEYVDPHRGSMQALGIIVGWSKDNKPSTRKKADRACIEIVQIMAPWNNWAEENYWIQSPFPDEDQYDEQHVKDRFAYIPNRIANDINTYY